MTNTPKRKVEKAEEFWGRKQATVEAFDRGDDTVAKYITALKVQDEAVVES
jgi:hypothetical protein